MKDTRLDDSAAIYTKKEERNARANWKFLSKKEKAVYFKDYYLKFVIIGAVVIGFLIWFLITLFSPKKENMLNVTLINSSMDDTSLAGLNDTISKSLNLDPEKEEILVDNSLFLSDKDASQATMASEQKMTVFAYSGDLDIIIAPRDVFERYVANGFYYNLAEALPTDLYNQLSDNLVLERSKEDKESLPYGIQLKGYETFDGMQTKIEDPVIGICSNSKHLKASVNTIKLMTDATN